MVCARMRGYTEYKDRNRCAEQAMDRLFSFEHQDHDPCTPDWYPIRDGAALPWNAFLVLLPMAAIGLLVARRPRVGWAALWSALTIGSAAAWFVATFDLDLFSDTRTVGYWPSAVVSWASLAFLLIHLVQLIACGIYGIVVLVRRSRARRRARAEEPDPMPRARVVKD